MKKFMTGLVSVSLLVSLLGASCYAIQKKDVPGMKIAQNTQDSSDEKMQGTSEVKEMYTQFKGKIVGVTQGDKILITVEDSNGKRMKFHVTQNTFITDKTALTYDNEIVCYYNENMSENQTESSPDIEANVIYAASEKSSVFVGKFVKNSTNESGNTYVDSNNKLIIQTGESTEIISADGKKFTENLNGQKLAVFYTIETKSLPARTTPQKIVVLSEKPEIFQMHINVNDKFLESPAAYKNANDVIMVPLKEISNALGLEVITNSETKVIYVGKLISLQVGKNAYTYAKMGPVELSAPPESKDGAVFVPLDFFLNFTKISEAYATEGQITINSKDVSN